MRKTTNLNKVRNSKNNSKNTNTKTKKEEKENLHDGHRDRLRDDMIACDFNPPSPHKLLEFMLTCCIPRIDVNPLAHKLINTFGSFSNVLDAKRSDLKKVSGVGDKVATFLYSYKKIMYYYSEDKGKTSIKLTSSRDYYNHFGKALADEPIEKLMLIILNNKSESRRYINLAEGAIDQVKIDPLTIYDICRDEGFYKIILLHNHPSGDCRPSFADDVNTENIFNKLKKFQIEIVDHLIVGRNSFYSFKDDNKLLKYENAYKLKYPEEYENNEENKNINKNILKYDLNNNKKS